MKVTHDSFVCTRSVRAGAATAFRAWTEIDKKSQWFVGPAGVWTQLERSMDVRVGGKEVVIGGFPDGDTSHFDATYLDIVPNERIVFAYRMSVSNELISVSLSTVEFLPNTNGCEIKYTEQNAYYGEQYGQESRLKGTEMLMDQVAGFLEGAA